MARRSIFALLPITVVSLFVMRDSRMMDLKEIIHVDAASDP